MTDGDAAIVIAVFIRRMLLTAAGLFALYYSFGIAERKASNGQVIVAWLVLVASWAFYLSAGVLMIGTACHHTWDWWI